MCRGRIGQMGHITWSHLLQEVYYFLKKYYCGDYRRKKEKIFSYLYYSKWDKRLFVNIRWQFSKPIQPWCIPQCTSSFSYYNFFLGKIEYYASIFLHSLTSPTTSWEIYFYVCQRFVNDLFIYLFHKSQTQTGFFIIGVIMT